MPVGHLPAGTSAERSRARVGRRPAAPPPLPPPHRSRRPASAGAAPRPCSGAVGRPPVPLRSESSPLLPPVPPWPAGRSRSPYAELVAWVLAVEVVLLLAAVPVSRGALCRRLPGRRGAARLRRRGLRTAPSRRPGPSRRPACAVPPGVRGAAAGPPPSASRAGRAEGCVQARTGGRCGSPGDAVPRTRAEGRGRPAATRMPGGRCSGGPFTPAEPAPRGADARPDAQPRRNVRRHHLVGPRACPELMRRPRDRVHRFCTYASR